MGTFREESETTSSGPPQLIMSGQLCSQLQKSDVQVYALHPTRLQHVLFKLLCCPWQFEWATTRKATRSQDLTHTHSLSDYNSKSQAALSGVMPSVSYARGPCATTDMPKALKNPASVRETLVGGFVTEWRYGPEPRWQKRSYVKGPPAC